MSPATPTAPPPTVAERLERVRERVAAAAARAGRAVTDVTLVAVSKTHPVARVRDAFAAGALDFGENYVQELVGKQRELGSDLAGARWHFIGHLQKNKAKDIVGRVVLVHGVGSVELTTALGKRAVTAGVVQDVLLEVNLAGEASKSGVSPSDVPVLVEAARATPGLALRGFMAIPPPVKRATDNRVHFRALAALARAHGLPLLSMGMSDDFEIAIEEGATHVRVGTAIFGAR